MTIIIDNGVIEGSHREMTHAVMAISREMIQYVAESDSEDINRRR